jgi:aryl-alcohol dehydrogenase-like predicted oxidoreductase
MRRGSRHAELTQAVHDNLRNLSLEALDVVNLRNMFDGKTSMEPALTVLADLQREGLVRHIGLSNVTPAQIAEGRRTCPIVCVQNQYNVAHRADDPLIGELAREGICVTRISRPGTRLRPSKLSSPKNAMRPLERRPASRFRLAGLTRLEYLVQKSLGGRTNVRFESAVCPTQIS